MGQHGAAFIWHVEQIAVAFLALAVSKSGIGVIARFFPVIFISKEMNRHIFNAVVGLGKEKVEGIHRGGQVAVHTIDNDT